MPRGMVRCRSCTMWSESMHSACQFCQKSFAEKKSNLIASASFKGTTEEGVEMDGGILRILCKEAGMPTSPMATTKLYLNCHRFASINKCIEDYPEVDSIWLERNKIRRIENLDTLVKLKTLYLHGNLISRIEGLSALTNLQVLSLSGNFIERIEGVESLTNLKVFFLADNRISQVEDMEQIVACQSLCELDLTNNNISDVGVIDLLGRLPNLQHLTLLKNPVANASDPKNNQEVVLPNYRKVVVARLKGITCLDKRAVNNQERRYCEAWFDDQGGGDGGEGDGGGPAADAGGWPSPVLYDIFRILADRSDLRALFGCTLACKKWMKVCALVLPEARARRAGERVAAALPAVEASQAAFDRLSQADFADLGAQAYQPTTPVLHTLHVVSLLWPAGGGGAVEEAGAGRWEGVGSPGGAGSGEPGSPAGGGPIASPVVSPVVSPGGAWPPGGGEEQGEEAAVECAIPDFDSQRWRNVAWERGQRMMRAPEFPALLMESLPPSALRLRQVRAATGSADDLDEYVPMLDAAAAGRGHGAMGVLAEWVLAVEAQAHAQHELERATSVIGRAGSSRLGV